jgi:DNA-binding LytR/AlgR family response regulator
MTSIVIRNEQEIRIIHVENLLAVKVENYICTFYVENETSFSCTKSLKETIAELPDFFLQINRNCIVNTNKIKTISLKHRKITIQGGITYSFSERNANSLKKIYSKEYV